MRGANDQKKQGYLTIATGSEQFLDYAINLRLSCHYNDPNRPFALLTDEELVKKAHEKGVSYYFDKIILYQGNYISWQIKFDLFDLSPFDETFYIDADSLMIKDPNPAWEAVAGKHFAVQGQERFKGEWYGRTEKEIMEMLGISYFPKFNGGFIYFDKSTKALQVFEKSHDLFEDYDKLGFKRSRGLEADEPIIGVAMALCNLKPVPDSSDIMFSIIGINYWFRLSVPKLRLSLRKRKVHFKKHGLPVSPIILHCCAGLRESWRYRRAARQLKKLVTFKKSR